MIHPHRTRAWDRQTKNTIEIRLISDIHLELNLCLFCFESIEHLVVPLSQTKIKIK